MLYDDRYTIEITSITLETNIMGHKARSKKAFNLFSLRRGHYWQGKV